MTEVGSQEVAQNSLQRSKMLKKIIERYLVEEEEDLYLWKICNMKAKAVVSFLCFVIVFIICDPKESRWDEI